MPVFNPSSIPSQISLFSDESSQTAPNRPDSPGNAVSVAEVVKIEHPGVEEEKPPETAPAASRTGYRLTLAASTGVVSGWLADGTDEWRVRIALEGQEPEKATVRYVDRLEALAVARLGVEVQDLVAVYDGRYDADASEDENRARFGVVERDHIPCFIDGWSVPMSWHAMRPVPRRGAR